LGPSPYEKWSINALQPFLDVYKRSRLQNGEKVNPLKSLDEQNTALDATMSQQMLAQKKKVIVKRETDKSFGFLKLETTIKPESRLSK